MNADKKPLRIGILIDGIQFTDIAALDILGSMSTQYLSALAPVIPQIAKVLPLSVPHEYFYIASTTTCSVTMTADMRIEPTHTYANAPRALDFLIVGGPSPLEASEDSLQYMREAAKETKFILVICTGGIWAARSGILDDKNATANRVFLPLAREVRPEVQWVDQRWVSDDGHFEGAEIWTAGGVGCGIDMTIEFAKKNMDPRLVEVASACLDLDMKGRGQFYSVSASEFF